MTKRQMFGCVLTVLILVMSGCGWTSSSESAVSQNTNAPAPSPTQPPAKPEFTAAATDLQNAFRPKQQSGRPSGKMTVQQVKASITTAMSKLGGSEENVDEFCTGCSDDTKTEVKEVLNALTQLKTDLGADSKPIADLDPSLRLQAEETLSTTARKLKQLNNTFAGNPLPNQSPASTPPTRNDPPKEPDWWETGLAVAKVLAIVLGLTLLAAAFIYLWRYSWRTVEANLSNVVNRHVSAVRDAQPDFTQKLSSLSSSQHEMSSRLTELDTELRSLTRLVRESLASRNDRRPALMPVTSPHYPEPLPKDEPDFPVSAVDYLGKMDRFANVVRPDFQNGILVHDPDGKGEFVLIRDSRYPDETQPLFVVPRATQFQTKQDFYTYYQKYYECVRPSAGDVWIIDPAVVEKVSGGWQLREKGVLEIR
jgi:hypothetical protein